MTESIEMAVGSESDVQTADVSAAPVTAAAAPAAAPAAMLNGFDDRPMRSLELLHGVELSVTVELGHARMSMKDLLGLRAGRIVELDRAVGSPVDVMVNGTLLARGEVVVVDDELGVRITEIVGDNADVDA